MSYKKKIYEILTDLTKSVDQKYHEIIKNYPDYLYDTQVKKAIYEKIEGFFHDGLGTYFELLVFDKINQKYNLGYELTDKTTAKKKMENGILLYEKFFPNNQYNVNLKQEIYNIEKGAEDSIDTIEDFVGNEKIKSLTHSYQDFRQGNARDIFVKLESGEEINFSLKTDKSGKVALSEGQTPDIFEKVYKRYFKLDLDKYQTLKSKLFGTTKESEIFEHFQNVALLTQKVIIEQLELENAQINDFKNAKITNKEILEHFLKTLKIYKNGKDNSVVILVDRRTGNVGEESILDEIDINNLELNDFSFTPCKPSKYDYGTEPGIKYKGKTFVSFQVKHKRGSNVGKKFQDITVRLRTK